MTRSEFDAACEAANRDFGHARVLIGDRYLTIRHRPHTADPLAYWFRGEKITRAQAEALVTDAMA